MSAEMQPSRSDPAPTRRDVLLGAGAVAGSTVLGLRADHAKPRAKAAPFDFTGKLPTRTRKSFHDLSDDEVRAFADAVGYLRDRPLIHDPLQWDNLVSIHAHHCTQNAATGAFQVHWSWFFLPWHRAYLFFVERHLAHAISKHLGDRPIPGERFALPYWDWVNHKGVPNTREREKKKLGSPFFGLDPAVEFDPSSQPDPNRFNFALFDGYRGPTAEKPDMSPANEPNKGWKDYTKYIREHMTSAAQIKSILQQQNFCVFGGFPTTDASTGQGLLESIPHNAIHDWVGTRFGSNRDMGSLRYAALDPLFYLHHGNIDRIWGLYQYTPDPDGKPTGTNCIDTPTKLKAWADQAFEFRDVDGKLVSVTVRDTVKNMKSIKYQAPSAGDKLLVKGVDRAPAERSVGLLAERGEPATLTNDKPATFTFKPEAFKKDGRDVRAGKPISAALEIQVGEFAYEGRFQVRVFANKEDATHKTPLTDSHFVGSFQVLDSHRSAKGGTHRFFVDVSPGVSNFFKIAPGGKDVKLTLVARGGGGDGFRLQVKQVVLRVSGPAPK